MKANIQTGLSGVFTEIYANRRWGNKTTPRSGSGSNPDVAAPYVALVDQTVSRYAIRRILDIGHGDWEMWSVEAFQHTEYLGVDVADGLSEELQLRFGTSNRNFKRLDAVSEDLPSADLVLCKDVLQHLSNEHVLTILEKLTKFKLVVICHDVMTSNPSISGRWVQLKQHISIRSRLKQALRLQNPFKRYRYRQNEDIPSGEYRCLDLEKDPWNLEQLGFRVLVRSEFPAEPTASKSVRKRVWLLEAGMPRPSEDPAAPGFLQ